MKAKNIITVIVVLFAITILCVVTHIIPDPAFIITKISGIGLVLSVFMLVIPPINKR